MVSENGGGSFVFLYIFLGFLVGLPVLILEMFLSSQKPQSYRVIPVVLNFFVLTYYSVISGWVLFFLTDFLMLFVDHQRMPQGMYILFQYPWLQWLLASVHIIAFVFLWRREKESLLWRFRRVMMPLLVLILGLLLYQSLQLTSITDSLRYLFYPDFEEWSRFSIGHAIGHVFFTLSVGFGVFLTIRDFYDKDDYAPMIGLRMTIMDMVFSLVSLMVVFPLIFLQKDKVSSNPFLLFDFLPPAFLNFRYGVVFGFLFFLLLYLSALNSSLILFRALISLTDPVMSSRIPKDKRGFCIGLSLFVFSSFPAMGLPFYFFFRVNNFNLIEQMDHVLIHWLLPLGVLCLLLATRDRIQSVEFRNFVVRSSSVTSAWFYVPLKLILLYFIPGLILFDFISRIF